MRRGAEGLGLIRDGLLFGDLLRGHRLAAGLSQERLAERAGLSARGLSDLERGARRAPRRATVLRLAEALALADAERAALLAASRQVRSAKTGHRGAPPPAVRLPLPLTSFVGRDREMLQVQHLLRSARLVTLSGPGGVGKTRLALEVARLAAAEAWQPVVWVDLAPTRDPRVVLELVAGALDVRDPGGAGVRQALERAIGRRSLVLVLDNFEQVLEAAPELAHLLDACSGLKVLATSREPLRLPGEQVVEVPPLALPAEAERVCPEQVGRAPAVALFVERAQVVDPRFRLETANAPAVAELCRRLDGLPLAIELAAARSRALPPRALLERIAGGLDLLRGLRDQPARHASLRAVLDSSFRLLSQPEQVLLRRLAVFAGGCTPEAAEAVCAGHGLAAESVLDRLGGLVERSLVVLERGTPPDRYRLLETVREYAAEQLQASGEHAALRRQHALWFLGLAEQAAPHIWGPRTAEWLERLEREHDNLRAALGWSLEAAAADGVADVGSNPTPAEVGLRLGAALMPFWDLRGRLGEGQAWLERLLALRGSAAASPSAWIAGTYAAGYAALTQGDYAQGAARFQATLEQARDTGQTSMHAQALLGLGCTGVLEGRDLDQAQRLLQQALRLARESDNAFVLGASLYWLGEIARTSGDLDGAQALFMRNLALTRQLGNLWGTAYVLASLGRIALAQVDLAAARRYQQESLALRRDLDDRRGIAFCLEDLAWVAGLDGRAEYAACLFGASAALHDELGLPLVPVPEWRAWHARAEATARERLGAEGYAAAWSAGRALPRAEAVALALTPSSPARAARVVVPPS